MTDLQYFDKIIKINICNKNAICKKQNYLIINDNSCNIINKITKINSYKNLFLIYDDNQYYTHLLKHGVTLDSMNHIILLKSNDTNNLNKINNKKMNIIYLKNIYPYDRFMIFLYFSWNILIFNGYLIIDRLNTKNTPGDAKKIKDIINSFIKIYKNNIKIYLKKNVYIIQKLFYNNNTLNNINTPLNYIQKYKFKQYTIDIDNYDHEIELNVKYNEKEPPKLKSYGYTDEYNAIANNIIKMYDNSKTKYDKYFLLFELNIFIINNKNINIVQYLINSIKYDKDKYMHIYNILTKIQKNIGVFTLHAIDLIFNNFINIKKHYNILDNSKFKADTIYKLLSNNITYKYIDNDSIYNINSKYYDKNIKKYNFIKLRGRNKQYNANYYLFYLLINNQSKGGDAILVIKIINKYTIDIIRILSKYYTNISIKNNNLSLKSFDFIIYLYNFKGVTNQKLNYYYDILIKIHNHNLYIENLLNNNNLINDIIKLNKNIIKDKIVDYNNNSKITKVYLQSNKKLQNNIFNIIFKKQIDIFLEYYLKYIHLFR